MLPGGGNRAKSSGVSAAHRAGARGSSQLGEELEMGVGVLEAQQDWTLSLQASKQECG